MPFTTRCAAGHVDSPYSVRIAGWRTLQIVDGRFDKVNEYTHSTTERVCAVSIDVDAANPDHCCSLQRGGHTHQLRECQEPVVLTDAAGAEHHLLLSGEQ
jgi:hypothetical protein